MAAGNIPKSAYNDFKLLHELGTQRIAVNSESVIATRRPDGSLAIAVWNYAPPGVGGIPKQITLLLNGVTGAREARIQTVDHEHGSALDAWLAMGKPDFPTRAQQDALRKAAQLAPPEVRPLSPGGVSTLTLTLAPQALAVIEIRARPYVQ